MAFNLFFNVSFEVQFLSEFGRLFQCELLGTNNIIEFLND